MQRRIATLERVQSRWSRLLAAAGISQSLSSHERMLDLGEPRTVGNNFCHGGDFWAFDTITYIGGFPMGTCLLLMKLGFHIEIKKNPHFQREPGVLGQYLSHPIRQALLWPVRL
jgi:hypothetical protein